MFDCIDNPELFKGYKIKLYPTEDQKIFLNRQIELFRWVYNWVIGVETDRYKMYKNGEIKEKPFLGVLDLYSLLIEERKKKEWLKDINTHTAKEAIRNALIAYKKFFSGCCRYPKFKSKKTAKKSFQVRNEANAFYFDNGYVRISGLPFGDKILCKNNPIPKGDGIRYYRCTITFDGYNYWLSLNVERDTSYLKEIDEPTEYSEESIGIDIGYRKLAQLSTGKTYYHPDIHVLERRKRHQQSRLSKMRNNRVKAAKQAKTKLEDIPISNNEEKLMYKYYLTRQRINNIHLYNYHKVTTEIANMYPKRIVIEDLKLKNLRSKKKKCKGIKQTPLYLFRDFLTYKCRDRGIELVFADKFFPSTKMCSNCGSSYKIGSEKVYKCRNCGLIIDRDMNAAINLSRYGV